jgi:hypothetical protein
MARQHRRLPQAKELVARNPFADLVSAVKANTSRLHFVSRDVAGKVLKQVSQQLACLDHELTTAYLQWDKAAQHSHAA